MKSEMSGPRSRYLIIDDGRYLWRTDVDGVLYRHDRLCGWQFYDNQARAWTNANWPRSAYYDCPAPGGMTFIRVGEVLP